MAIAGRVYDGELPVPVAAPDLVVVGAASRDITGDDPRGWRLGGAATYCSLTAARLGLRVGCLMGVDEEAAGSSELNLIEAAGIDLRRVPLASGPVFENLEEDGRRRQRWLSASDVVPALALPGAWSAARGWLLVPVAGEVPENWANVPMSEAHVGVGPQGLVREFGADGWVRRVDPEASRVLAAAGLVCGSLDDFGSDMALAELRRLAPNAAVVLTGGESGGVVLRGAATGRYRAIPAPHVVDPTGAGDVFLAALMAAWLRTGELATPRALRFAAAAASCAVEGAGLAGVPTLRQVADRLRGSGRAAS